MTKSGFDLDEIERLLGDIGDTIDEWDDDEPRDDWYGWQRNILKLSNSAPAMIAEIRELRAENARLRGKVSDALAFLRSAPLESGYCCCGSPVDGHGIGDGHAPVDDLAYYASNLASDLSAALTGEPQ